jgi:N-formylglutamate amidohydrolase
MRYPHHDRMRDSDISIRCVFDAAMDVPATLPDAEEIAPFRLSAPERPFAPVVFTSAHSGRAYSADLMSGVRLCPLSLRRSEDCFVDELFGAAPLHGAPLLAANFPRAFCDANREAWELDPNMFTDRLPAWVNTTSSRVSAGLGTIAKVVASGESIYTGKLPFAEAERRIYTYWRPFHETLTRLIADIKDRFGYCLLIDCHSMPSGGQARRGPSRPVDFVLGDLHGSACASRVTRAAKVIWSAATIPMPGALSHGTMADRRTMSTRCRSKLPARCTWTRLALSVCPAFRQSNGRLPIWSLPSRCRSMI